MKKNVKHKHLFDFSNYPKASKFFDETKKKSYWKNEGWFWWIYCRRICWIKVKNVFYKKIDGKELQTAKGVNIAEFNEFKDVLYGKKIIRHKM